MRISYFAISIFAGGLASLSTPAFAGCNSHGTTCNTSSHQSSSHSSQSTYGSGHYNSGHHNNNHSINSNNVALGGASGHTVFRHVIGLCVPRLLIHLANKFKVDTFDSLVANLMFVAPFGINVYM